MSLKKAKEDIYRCFRCGYCREMIRGLTNTYLVCPSREYFRWEEYDARGRVLVARALIEGDLEYTDKLIESVYTCCACGLCTEVCPMLDFAKVDMPKIIRAWREEIVAKGLGPLPRLKEVNEAIEKDYNPLGQSKAERLNWAQGMSIPRTGDTLYFAGCYAAYRRPEIARATVNILNKNGVELSVLNEEKCCGVPPFWNGRPDLGRSLATSNVQAIKESGAKEMVTTCPGCYMTFKEDYPEYVGSLDFEVMHITQYLQKLIDNNQLQFNRLEKTVTYHDPCHLGRFSKIYEPPRKIIESIPGINFVEMLRNKENAWCCGAGIVVAPAFPDLSFHTAEARIKEALDTGSDMLVTACPNCVTQLRIAAKRAKADIEVIDLINLVENTVQ